MLAQVLKLTGASHITLAANKGTKMEVAKGLDVADEYLELDRANPEQQWQDLKKKHPYGFDCVVSKHSRVWYYWSAFGTDIPCTFAGRSHRS